MGEPTNVLDTVANAGENKVTVYNDNLVEIFAHAKTEILELNEKMENRELLRLRNVLFEQVLGNFPQYNGCELFARRKKAYLAEDIYILGHCLVNKLEDRRLKNIVKGNQANESTNVIQDEVSPNSDLDILQSVPLLNLPWIF